MAHSLSGVQERKCPPKLAWQSHGPAPPAQKRLPVFGYVLTLGVGNGHCPLSFSGFCVF